MTRKVAHNYHLATENCLLKQKYTELTERIQLLEAEIQELRTQSNTKNTHHANTLIFLQNKNSELYKTLLEKTNENVKIQKPNHPKYYENGDYLRDSDSDSDEERAIPPVRPLQPVPPISIIPHPIKPKDMDRHWGHHGGNHWGGHHWGHNNHYPYWWRHNYRDISGNMNYQIPPHKTPTYPPYNQPIYPYHKPPQQSLKDFVNPLLSFEEFDRVFTPPSPKKPTYFIPPAIHHPKEG